MKTKKKAKEEVINVRVWKKTWLRIKVLAAKRGISVTQQLDEIIPRP